MVRSVNIYSDLLKRCTVFDTFIVVIKNLGIFFSLTRNEKSKFEQKRRDKKCCTIYGLILLIFVGVIFLGIGNCIQ